MATTLHKGRLFWLGVLALFTAAASLAIRGAIASGLKAEWIDPVAPLQAGELIAASVSPQPMPLSNMPAQTSQ